ncbi:MAG: hypothetical protein ABSF88_11665 [Candidatus Aminicenantales bacterium]
MGFGAAEKALFAKGGTIVHSEELFAPSKQYKMGLNFHSATFFDGKSIKVAE